MSSGVMSFVMIPRIHKIVEDLDLNPYMFYLIYALFIYAMIVLNGYTYAWGLFTGVVKDAANAVIEELEVSS